MKKDAGKEQPPDFYRDMEQLLLKQQEAQPGQFDIRVKLIELYYETHRSTEFLKAAHALRRMIKQLDVSREWQRVASMGRMLLPGEAIFSGHDVDRIEYIGDITGLPGEAGKHQRFGTDEQSRALFDELGRQYESARKDPRFLAELELFLLSLPMRRPTQMVAAKRLSDKLGGAQIFIKREDFAAENTHLTFAVAGQALLARRLGCKILVTAADGRRGAVTAAIAARLGMEAVVYMEHEAAERAAAQSLSMRLMGAQLDLIKTTKLRNGDVREAALAHWAKDPKAAFFIAGVDAVPPPYPMMTQEFTSGIGRECKRQIVGVTKRPPDLVVTRGERSADALAFFPAFIADTNVRLACVDPAIEIEKPGAEAKSPTARTQGERTGAQKVLDRTEYPSIAREHAWFKASKRIEYVTTTRADARNALTELARLEAIVAPVDSAHAVAYAMAEAAKLKPEQAAVVVMSETFERGIWDIQDLLNEKK